jgi:flagellar hook-associated protein 3 FlgL
MRVSTSQVYALGSEAIGKAQSTLLSTQQKISTGKRLLTPSDDPAASARAIVTAQAKARTDRFAAVIGTASDQLGEEESVLGQVTDLLTEIRTSAVAAGGGPLSGAHRASIATELKGRLEDLLALANTKGADGSYIFSGYEISTPAFSLDATTGTYAYGGDTGQREVAVADGRMMPTNDDGANVFIVGGESVFDTVQNLINTLGISGSTPAGKTALAAGISTALSKLSSAEDNVLAVRSEVGARMSELDSLSSANSSRALQYAATLSDLQDLDYASALSDFSRQQVALEAAQKSFLQVSGLSLFKFM